VSKMKHRGLTFDGRSFCATLYAGVFVCVASRTCPSAFVRCNNGQCIHQEEFCDNESTCNDGSQPDRSQNCRKFLYITVNITFDGRKLMQSWSWVQFY